MSLMLVSGAAFALPTATQIETAMQQGNWQQADAGLTQVLQAHPNNARAHYLYAQVLDREGRYADALAQIQQAKTLDPQVRFTDPSRFAQTEARIRSDAARAGAIQANRSSTPLAQQAAPAAQMQQSATMQPVVPERHGPSMGLWIGLAFVVVVIAFVLRWTLKRARSKDDTRADDDRRVQLKRATELLNAVRSLKLDVKISTVPGHEALEKEVEGLEAQLRQLVETLSGSPNPVPPYQLDDLERQVESLRARADGRPDPNASGAAAYGPAPLGSGDSAYAREADERFGRQQAPYPYPQQPVPQQQPPVIVQQGGGFGGGMGGLLTGVLLGQVLNSGGRDRIIERDVLVDPDEARRRAGDVDFGQGSNDWSDGGGGGGIDTGSNDDSGGGWSDT
ncbi:hypothetical protein R52603_02187 [Paraburkholderia saeva]|uniref:Tetratricopeptide repeat protein n=2 Tax=Paraburkholderia saeva TaxID=2777537 RepID=A0A9N8S172_9BURK|nr:hypothetical protein R70241_01188 [Paraburkholderia saeva]CAG4896414.1 hypothetical protein R52603_02187 [Paraburkholderia saeva]CAG4920890.1 hypothetical protein LMG31841_05031 [Paraburkholderia saeva]